MTGAAYLVAAAVVAGLVTFCLRAASTDSRNGCSRANGTARRQKVTRPATTAAATR